MRRFSGLHAWWLSVLLCVWAGVAHAQDTRQALVVEIRQADGKRVGGAGVRDQKPEDVFSTPLVNMRFLQRPDVKDEAGRIVTAVGLTAWKEGDGARVWVFSVVPKEGVPNQYYASREGIANTRREPLFELSMKPGDVRRLDEMEAWGFDPFVLELVARDR